MKKITIVFAAAALSLLGSFSAMALTNFSPSVDIATLKDAAMHDDADAAFSLCNAYTNGRGVPKNEEEADKWCKKSSQIVAQKAPESVSRLAPAR